MIELLAVGLLLFAFGGSSKSKAPSGAKIPGTIIPTEAACEIRVDVDGRNLAICRAGARYRMYVDHELDARTFSDLQGVLQRAVVVTTPASAARITFETPHGTATVTKALDGSGYDWSFMPSDASEPVMGLEEPTMLDALGALYKQVGSQFFT